MRYDEFIMSFKENVYALPFAQQLDLALYVCKRLFPNYAGFVNENNSGNFDLLLDGIKLAELFKNAQASLEEVAQLLPELEEAVPDTDEFGNLSGTLGLYAGASVAELLQFILDKDPIHIYNIGTYLTDSLDVAILEETDTSEFDLDHHPLMMEARTTLIRLSAEGPSGAAGTVEAR